MSKTVYYFSLPILFLLTLFMSGCLDIPKNLVMPQWDVDLNIPIVNRSYSLNDIIKKQNYISVQDSGTPNDIYLIQSDEYSISKDVSTFVQAIGNESTNDNVITGAGSKTIYVQFPGGVTINKAVFSSGNLSYSFSNPSAQTVTVSFSIPGISINGNTFSKTIQIGALGTVSNTVDFAGADYNLPPNQPSFFSNSLQVILDASSTLPATIGVNLTASDFYFSTATGIIPKKRLGEKSSTFALNIGNAKDYRGKVQLKDANLYLDAKYIPAATNNNPFQIEVDSLTIIGIRNDGTAPMYLDIPDSAKTFIFSGTDKHFDFNSLNSKNITDFISYLPDSVEVSAVYYMNPNNQSGTVASGDSVKFTASFSTTSYLAINNSSTTDTTNMGDLSDNDRSKIRDSQSAFLSINVQNGIPLNASMVVKLVDSLYHPLFTLTNNITSNSTFTVSPANVDQNGNVTSEGVTSLKVQLDSTQTDLLSHAQYAIYTVSIQTPNSPTRVAIRPDDQIQIQVFGGVKFRVSNNNIK